MAARAEANDALALRIEKFFSGVWDSITYSWDYRERALVAAGVDPASDDSKRYDVHHVVQQGHLGSAVAQANLRAVGIGIHDLENLVVVQRSTHQGMHTDAYRTAVNAATTAALPGARPAMSATLTGIKAALTTKGSFP